MLRFWVEQIAALESAAITLILFTLVVAIVAWIVLRRSKQSSR